MTPNLWTVRRASASEQMSARRRPSLVVRIHIGAPADGSYRQLRRLKRTRRSRVGWIVSGLHGFPPSLYCDESTVKTNALCGIEHMRPPVEHDRQGGRRYLGVWPSSGQMALSRPSGRRQARPCGEFDECGVGGALAACGCDGSFKTRSDASNVSRSITQLAAMTSGEGECRLTGGARKP